MQAARRRQQRGCAGRRGERLLGPLHLALLVEIGRGQPLVQGQGMARRVEDQAAVDDAERRIHAQVQAFEHRREVPGIDRLTVDRGLAADRLESGAVQEGRGQLWLVSAWSSRAMAAAARARACASAGSGAMRRRGVWTRAEPAKVPSASADGKPAEGERSLSAQSVACREGGLGRVGHAGPPCRPFVSPGATSAGPRRDRLRADQ